jgi:hypothetical protein
MSLTDEIFAINLTVCNISEVIYTMVIIKLISVERSYIEW